MKIIYVLDSSDDNYEKRLFDNSKTMYFSLLEISNLLRSYNKQRNLTEKELIEKIQEEVFDSGIDNIE